VSDTWGLAKVVRKVEFKLLHLRTSPRVTSPSVLVAEQSLPLCPILIGSRWCIQGCGTSEPLSARSSRFVKTVCSLGCDAYSVCSRIALICAASRSIAATRAATAPGENRASCLSFINKHRLPSKTLTLTLSEYNNGLHTAPPAPAASGGIQAEADSVEDSGLSLLS
jgi:hypothetical protein